VLYAIFGSFFGSAGYTLSLLFFSPLVCSSVHLLEAIIAQALGYSLGLDQLPGIMTAVGSLFAIIGILYIENGTRERVNDETNYCSDLELILYKSEDTNQAHVKSQEDPDLSHVTEF
jgi:uncharacterized membrane protein